MIKRCFCATALLASVTFSHANLVVSPWTPTFQGVDQAAGTNFPSTTFTNSGVVLVDSTLQVAHCIRVDLTDPGVKLFTTPAAANAVNDSRETLSLSISNFLKAYKVQVAVDANFYSVNPGGSDPTAEGLPADVEGLLICTGKVVSLPDGGRFASLLFTTNNVPSFNLLNRPPTTTPSGTYTAVSGYYPVLTNGVNVWALYATDFNNLYSPGDGVIHQAQPRTAFGVSKDKRYLYLMTIDGRQGGYSDGALDVETAMWLLLFGAWDGLNMDGGGSTAMYTADCKGSPVRLNHSSYISAYGRERILGDHFGVYAQPLPTFITNVGAVPADTSATITWTTVAPADSQVEYGLTPSFGTSSTNDPTFVTNHSLILSGLTPGKHYFYRVLSSDGTTRYSSDCGNGFSTTNNGVVGLSFGLTAAWKYTTANLDGVNWRAAGYSDAAWTGPSAGVLWVDSSNPGTGNPAIQFLPLNTEMPLNSLTTYPFTTYYFRRHFTYTNTIAGATLTLSNYIDDGAAFYLNGVLINADFVNIPAANADLATGYYCGTGNADCPYVFTVSGDAITNLHSGDNVLAVEVHNFNAKSPDITFGCSMGFVAPLPTPPQPPFLTNVVIVPGETSATITWTTLSNSTSQVRYGLTVGLGSTTPLDSTPVTNHSVTLTNLLPLTNYFFRVQSTIGATQYFANGSFSTVPFYAELIALGDVWAFNTNNLDGTAWQGRVLDESTWLGDGPALLYIETNPAVAPRNTLLPATPQGLPAPTYYFRNHFVFNTNMAGFALVFTNYIDDGAVFYLNGREVKRVRMPAAPQPIHYLDLATACAPVGCAAATNAPDVFRLSGDVLTNLVSGGDNVLAAEVHQVSANSPNVVFGSALGVVRALASETRLRITDTGNVSTISWDGAGLTLQQANSLSSGGWTDVPGPIKASPYSVTNPPSNTFYRLRN